MSEYGAAFDQTAMRWAVVENEHDKIHPDRSECGGVGACSLMLASHRLEESLIGHLTEWRGQAL
ncbi:MAG: hypothetical protein ABW022_15715 [Actinoplanes sp.]